VSETAKDLIRQMMCVDPNKRLTMAGVLEHPWLADDIDNTSSVDKLMYPPILNSKSFKRSAADEESMMEEEEDHEATGTACSLNGRSKRVKH
jgi:serine/threonine protein kinase